MKLRLKTIKGRKYIYARRSYRTPGAGRTGPVKKADVCIMPEPLWRRACRLADRRKGAMLAERLDLALDVLAAAISRAEGPDRAGIRGALSRLAREKGVSVGALRRRIRTAAPKIRPPDDGLTPRERATLATVDRLRRKGYSKALEHLERLLPARLK